jgi:hypothetical protein
MTLPILDPIQEIIPEDWKYATIAKAETYPISWMNPNIVCVAHRDQGDRGTCVGQSASTWFDLNYVGLTGDKPSEDEFNRIKRNVINGDLVVFDSLLPQSFSAECIYQKSREIGNVTVPSGSYTSAAVRAMKEYGVCLESRWPTAKLPNSTYTNPPTDVSEEVKQHIIEGYAQIESFDEIKAAIYKHGAVLGSILIYENYPTMLGGDGTFPEPKGNITGAHALCWVGYDENNLYCLHSWGSWCGRIGKISRNYYNKANQGFYTVLDTSETKILRDQYVVLTLSSDVDAEFYLDNKYVGKGTVKASVERAQHYSIRVVYGDKEVTDVVYIENDTDRRYDFQIEPWYIRLIRAIFGRLMGR